MLRNEPPPGTKVRFTGELRESRGSGVGSLVRPLGKYFVDRLGDEFLVEFGGKLMTVTRAEIEEA